MDEKTLPHPVASEGPSLPTGKSRLRPLVALGALALFIFSPSSPFSLSPSLLLTPLASPSPPPLSEDGTTLAVQWSSCDGLSDRYSCATYEVPLDWTGKEDGVVKLAVIKYAADKDKKSLGSLFINPGGPGGSGVTAVQRLGPSLSTIVGGHYAIVSWDPRGIGKTEPAFRCFDTALEEFSFVKSTPQPASLPFNLTAHPKALDEYAISIRQVVDHSKLLNQACESKTRANIGRFMGTESVVRDLEVLARAVWTKKDAEKGIVYWGFSYGTIVGAYLTAIFPDRIGRVIIDGVVHPQMWASSPHAEFEDNIYQSTDLGIELFAESCVEAGFPRCALATDPPQSKEALLESLASLLDKTYDAPLLVTNTSVPGVVTTTTIVSAMFQSMYSPRTWPVLAQSLNDALHGDGRALLESSQLPFPKDPSEPASTTSSTAGVWCNDGVRTTLPANATDQQLAESFTNAVRLRLAKVSTWFGGKALFPQCDGFAMEEAGFGRYTGPFNKTLSNSILVVGNTADPVTSVQNAFAVNKIQPQSRVIHQDSGGHCSIALGSLCTIRHIRTYLLTGVLPPTNVKCATDEVLFPDLDDTYSLFAGLVGGEDLELMEALKEVGEGLVGREGFLGMV